MSTVLVTGDWLSFAKATRLVGWAPRSAQEANVAAAESLMRVCERSDA